MGPRKSLKAIDVLRHELKALRFILDNYHAGRLDADSRLPPDDFQSAESRQIYAAIVEAQSREAAEGDIERMDLDDVDIPSFLRLSGESYYTYPKLVRERAEAIRAGRLTIEDP